MAKQADYRASEHITTGDDLYTRPAFSLGNRPFHAWRAMLLRAFGATLGPDCHFYPGSKVWAPWNLFCADHVAAGDGVEIYNPSPMHFDSHVILSQDCYLCGATHDYNDPAFPLVSYRMHFEQYAWICARASVGPGVHVGEGAVLGLGAIATRDLKPWTVYGGNPAVALRERNRTIPEKTDVEKQP